MMYEMDMATPEARSARNLEMSHTRPKKILAFDSNRYRYKVNHFFLLNVRKKYFPSKVLQQNS